MPYVNPIPMIELGKQFEMRLSLHFDELLNPEEAKKLTAEYILEQSPETIASWLRCTDIKAVYPDELSEEDKERLKREFPSI